MWRGRLLVLLALLIGFGAAATLAGGASGQGACTVALRVNVFGPTSPQSSWALQGGLNSGKLATLRAVARGCALDHITGRWISGGTGAFPGSPRACTGPRCDWGVRSNFMSAAAFQASATSAGRTVRSNIVRVAWAGSGVVGTWRWLFAPPGSALAEHGTVTFSSDHTMTWSGGSNGTWAQAGNTVTLTWTSKKPVSVDTMTLSADGRTMNGANNTGWAVRGIRR
jgi:hypothetical protein